MKDMLNLQEAARAAAQALLPKAGLNKQREISRLIFEICKRDDTAPADISARINAKNFEQAKKELLALRYPISFKTAKRENFYLPKLNLQALPDAEIKREEFYPKNIFIEKEVLNSPLAQRALKLFPKAKTEILEKKTFCGSENYSKRKENLVIIKENFDFVKPCPCTKNCFCCGYNLVNLGFGCAYECSYCFLQQYQNLHAIVLPANIKDFLDKIEKKPLRKGPFPHTRIGSGEFTDSLLFDHITNYSFDIVDFFRGREEYFEFKTKSTNIDNLLKIPAAKNIVVGWSVNPQNVIDDAEALTTPLHARLAAAAKIAAHGYKTAFHFDPVIIHEGWRANYLSVIEKIKNTVPAESIAWISIGTLRFSRELKKCIESRFKSNTILDGEFLLDFDGKMRYPKALRKQVYETLAPALKKAFPGTYVYLCMEEPDLQI